MTLKVTPFNDRVLCVYAPSRHSTRDQLARECFFEGSQNYMENKNLGSENKIIFEDFNCTMDKMDRDGENKTKNLIDAVPITPCQNSSWINHLRITIPRLITERYPLLIIIMQFLLSGSPQKLKLEVSRYYNNSLLCKPEFSSATKSFPFLLKKIKNITTLQQVTVKNPPNLVLKRMLRYFLKIPSLKKILKLQFFKR